jgi:initiation factor 1A
MPRSNTIGGKHHKKGKKHRIVDNPNASHIETASANQVYALVKGRSGGSRLNVECSDNKNRSALIPGKFFKKKWMNPGDILLCDLNPSGDDNTCYVLHVYNNKEAHVLKNQGKFNFDVAKDADDEGFKFTDSNVQIKQKSAMPDLNDIGDSESDDDFGLMPNTNKAKSSGKKKVISSSSSSSEDDVGFGISKNNNVDIKDIKDIENNKPNISSSESDSESDSSDVDITKL